jgi:predicted NBD/HSP70 family sugar kinase
VTPNSLPQSESARGRNREDLREHNLSALVGLLHKFGTLSRAQLTSSTGLNRTTISNLVSELKELGLVYESQSTGPTGVGRPSVMVSLRADVVAFAVNTALDATTVGVVNLLGQVLTKARRPNPVNLTAAMAVQSANDLIIHMRANLAPGTRIIGIGVAIPGQVRVAEGLVRFAPAFKWIDAPFGPMLNKLSDLPVYIDNDASLGCLAERTMGSARKFSNIVYLFGGTNGIGGGVVIEGQQLRGASGYASELGHIRISDSDAKDYSGLVGTLESAVRRDRLLKLLGLKSATEDELEVAILSTNSLEAIAEFKVQIDSLSIGVANLVNIFNPEVVILSGFLASLFKFDNNRLLEEFRRHTLVASQEEVTVIPGKLNANLLMVGAAELPIRQIIENPSLISSLPLTKGRRKS